jgi:hypothetical protein
MTVDPSVSWPFEDPPSVAVLTTKHIMREGLPVLFVTHDEDDGSWQFHYGGSVSGSDAMIVGLAEVLKLHPELAELSDLPYGWQAERESPEHPWIRKPRVGS